MAPARPSALATVVGTWRCAPRPPGAAMAVGPGGRGRGQRLRRVRRGRGLRAGPGGPQRRAAGAAALRRVSDDDAFAVGLTCGGIIDIFVERVDPRDFPELGAVAEVGRRARRWPWPPSSIRAGRSRSAAAWWSGRTASQGGTRVGAARRGRDRRRPRAARRRAHRVLRLGPDGERAATTWRVRRVLRPAAADAGLRRHRLRRRRRAGRGRSSAIRVTVCDARPVFATAERFPEADEVVVEWPHRYLAAEVEAGRVDARTVLCVLTHDPKFDVPLLEVALRAGRPTSARWGPGAPTRTGWPGCGRRRHRGGAGPAASPIGLDIGARTPEETAVSVAAEIIARAGAGPAAAGEPRGPHPRELRGRRRASGSPLTCPMGWGRSPAVARSTGPAPRG